MEAIIESSEWVVQERRRIDGMSVWVTVPDSGSPGDDDGYRAVVKLRDDMDDSDNLLPLRVAKISIALAKDGK